MSANNLEFRVEPVTLDEISRALDAVAKIERPYGDNEHLAVTAPAIYNNLTQPDQEKVDEAVFLIETYAYDGGDDGPNHKQIRRMRKAGLPISFGPDQDDCMRYTGAIVTGEWTIRLGDIAANEEDED